MPNRTCRRCSAPFLPWSAAKHPGQAGSHCQACYNALARERHVRASGPSSRRPPRPPLDDYDPLTGQRPQGRRWQQLRADVIAEESMCWICGEEVDKTLKGTLRRGPHIDHIIPLASGGDYWDRDNLRLTHNACNARRGTGVQGELEGLRSRIAELEAEVSWLRRSRAA